MPVKINEVSGEQFLVVHVWGKLAKADYERFLPQFAELSQRPGNWAVVRHDRFPGLGPERLVGRDQIRPQARQRLRVATVGDNVWERVMWILIKPFTKAKAGTSTPRNMPPRANG